MNRRNFLRMGTCVSIGMLSGFGIVTLHEDAFARGVSSQESTKAKAIFTRLGASNKGERHKVSNGIFTLAPGDVLTFDCKGYCLDGDLPLPSDGDPLAFRPMKNYIAPSMRNLYVAIMKSHVNGAPKGIQVAFLVFAIRSDASHSSTLYPKDYAFVNRLVPGAEKLIQQAHRPPEFTFKPGLSFFASKPMPDALTGFSMLRSDGVAGQGISLSGLTVQGRVANGSTKPFVFDPSQWVLESSRDVQAVALPVVSAGYVAKGKAVANAQKPVAPSKNKQDTENPSQEKSQQNEEDEFEGH